MNAKHEETLLGIDQTRYYAPDEMSVVLQGIVSQFPELASLTSIGNSIRGRDLWMVELSNKERGPSELKPGELVFATMHAAEVMGAASALYLTCMALGEYGGDKQITDLLDNNVLYVIPYLNPDGAQFALDTPYRWVGNGRWLPGEEQPEAGFYQSDVDGDGRILEMRVRDPAGEWRLSERDPRLLVLREPGDKKGPFYRRFPEGYVRDYDGAEIHMPKPRDGNLNRNFPEDWGPEFRQTGSGEYPTSEPEVAALVRFVLDHPNLVGSISLHTNAGAILFPEMMSHCKRDVIALRRLAKIGQQMTDYRIIESVLSDFTVDKAKPRLGVSDEWLYRQRGLLPLTVELWDWLGRAGVRRETAMMSLVGPSEEEELQMLKWNDEVLEGKGFVSWYSFNHPQLGKLEIGGWNYMWPTRNAPPGHLLVEEAHRLAQFILAKASSTPKLHVFSVSTKLVEGDVYRVEATVGNLGFLPTYVSDRAREIGIAEPLRASLSVSEGITILGSSDRDLEHLAGWSERTAPWVPWNYLEWEPTKRKLVWLVRAETDGEVMVAVQGRQAGRAMRSTTLHCDKPLGLH